MAAPKNIFAGLTNEEAEISRVRYGSNLLTRKKKDSFIKQFAASFGDPIIKILLVALSVNIIFMFRDLNWYETAGIALAVLLATLVSTLSEYGSQSVFEKLQEEASNIKCRVKRGGHITEIAIGETVVGDIIYLQAGERLPADGILIEGSLTVDQSVLNGESKEARKEADGARYSPSVSDSDAFLSGNKLFRGTVVCQGEGMMLVQRVGGDTFYGKIAAEIQEDTVTSPLKEKLSDLAGTISVFGYIAAATVFASNLFDSIVADNGFDISLITLYLSDGRVILKDVMRAATLGITVIVMAVPEGLPMMITVVLSANMRRMLKDNVLVRKLVGIETSGSLNILFTDKTGTLTKGKLEVTRFICGDGKELDLKSLKKRPRLFEYVKLNCLYNNGAQIGDVNGKRQIIGGNSTDRALLGFIQSLRENIFAPVQNGKSYIKGEVIPFNSRDKYSSAEITSPERLFLIKGAPEKLIAGCAYSLNEFGETVRFDADKVTGELKRLAEDSVRMLALAVCGSSRDAKGLKNLTLVGFAGLNDEIRKECVKAIKDCAGAGIQVVMVTGDNKDTASAVARTLGLISRAPRAGMGGQTGEVLTGGELAALPDAELIAALPKIRVIARALPHDKSRLVRLAQESGKVAGMTGDGVNDAPALKRADVGFAMGGGTEVAKEAGDIVILDNNFASIVKAILYGRTVFKSIRKFLIFQLSINLCAVGVSVIGPFIGIETPVTVIQMLWINIIMDTLAGLAYAGEAPLAEYMREPPKKRNEKIINRYMYSQILGTGLYTTALCLLFFKLPAIRTFFRGEERYMLTAFFALFIFTGVFNSFSARTYRINLLSHIYKNAAFLFIMGAVISIQIVLIYYGGSVFRTAGLTLRELAFVILISSSVVLFDIGRKLTLRANKRKGFI